MSASTAISDHSFIVSLLAGNKEKAIELLPKIDPEDVISGIKAHKLVAAIGKQIDLLPESPIKTKLAEEYSDNKFYQLGLARELDQIQKLFNGIDFLPLKGPVLSQFLYNDPSERNSWDLDILIDVKDLDKCIEIMLSMGYDLITYFNSDKQKEAIIKHYHHVELYHETRGILVEIHWDLTDIKGRKTTLKDLIPNTNKVSIGTNEFHFLKTEQQFEYLCMHGSFHLFERLQWLYDLKVFWEMQSKEQIDKIKEHSKKNNTYNFFLLTLNLLNKCFDTPLSSDIQSEIESNSAVQSLTKLSQREIYLNSTLHQHSAWSEMVRTHKGQYYNVGFKGLIRSIFSRNVRPKNWKFFAFPDSVFFLNHLLSRMIWLVGKLVGKL